MCLFKECRSIRKFGLIQDYYRESQLEIRKKCTFSFYFIVRGKCQYGEGLLKLGCHSVKTVLDDEIVITTLHCSVLKFPRDGIKRWERQYLLRLKLCVGSELYFLVSRPRPRAEGGAVWCDLLTQTKLFMIKCYKNIGSYQLGWPYLHTVLQNV